MIAGSSFRRFSAIAVVVASFMLLVTLAGTASAQNEPVVVVRGSDTAYNMSETGDAPMINYPEGSNPPLIMAQQIGDGKVIGGGFAATLRGGEAYADQRWRDNEFEIFMDSTFQWLTDDKAPGNTTVLWYEGHNVYNTTEMCTWLIDNLEAMGYTIEGGVTEPFADISLSDYDVVLIPQLQLGKAGTGGDPSQLPSSDVQALKSYVEGGGGLIVTDQSDYGGHHFSDVHNKILAGIGAGFSFQDDDVDDPESNWGGEDYQPIGVVTDNAFGSDYQSATDSSRVGFYSLCTMKFGTGPALSVDLSPPENTAYPGTTQTYRALISYKGSGEKTFTVSVTDNYDWIQSASKNEVTLAKNETENVTVTITVPEDIQVKKIDWIKATVSGEKQSVSAKARLVSAILQDSPPYPKAESKNYYWFSTATLLVDDPAAPIMSGMATGFSREKKRRSPWPLLYAENEYPPCMAAALIGDGRVLVNGGGGSIRSSPSDWYAPIGSKVAPRLSRWLVNWKDPRNHIWLYYTPVSEGGTSAFMNAQKMSGFLNKLESGYGFNVITENGTTANITPELLENVDVFQITGDGVLSFTDSAINNLETWVNNGGSLFISSQSDYRGYSNVEPLNKLLSELGVSVTIQDDQLTDPVHWTQDGSHFPGVYLLDPRSKNSEFDMWWPAHSISLSILEPVIRGGGGAKENFQIEISNTGSADTTVGIDVSQTTNMENWTAITAVSEIDIASGETKQATINVQIPKVTELTRTEWQVTATDLTQDFISTKKPFRVLGEKAPTGQGGEEGGGGGTPWAMVGGAIAVIVIVAVAGFVVMRR